MALISILIVISATAILSSAHYVERDRMCAEIEMRYNENPELAMEDPGFFSYEEYRDNLVKHDPLNGLVC